MVARSLVTFSVVSVLFLFADCRRGPEVSFRSQPNVSIHRLKDFDLGYLLTHIQVAAESPLPHLLPENMKYSYRIMGLNEQGNCVPACPRSIIFVAIWNYRDYRDGHIQLYRIEGVRFWQFLQIEEFKADENSGYFLSFRFQSRPQPQSQEEYLAKIGFGGATVERAATKTSKQAMQPTAGGRTASLYFMKTHPLQATLALASGG